MIDWLIHWFRLHRVDDHIEVKLTDPAEKRAAKQRLTRSQARLDAHIESLRKEAETMRRQHDAL